MVTDIKENIALHLMETCMEYCRDDEYTVAEKIHHCKTIFREVEIAEGDTKLYFLKNSEQFKNAAQSLDADEYDDFVFKLSELVWNMSK